MMGIKTVDKVLGNLRKAITDLGKVADQQNAEAQRQALISAAAYEEHEVAKKLDELLS